jgi:hypothetical protein
MDQRLGVHEGVVQQALRVSADPQVEAQLPAKGKEPALDAVTYSRGAAVLGMIQSYMDSLEPEVFGVSAWPGPVCLPSDWGTGVLLTYGLVCARLCCCV